MPPLGGPHADTAHAAEVNRLVSTLRSFGVLTRPRLAEMAHADHWRTGTFPAALSEAVREHRIRRLGGDLYALDDSER